MDSEGFITLEEAAMLPCPYQPPYSDRTDLPFDAEIVANAAKAGALQHRWRGGTLMTRQTFYVKG